MTSGKQVWDDLLALSAQLNRQAFANPPLEGWLNSFLALLCERFAPLYVQGVQVVQVAGNVALRIASAGNVPAEASAQNVLDEHSPVAMALREGKATTMPNARIYPLSAGDEAIGAMILHLSGSVKSTTVLDRVAGLLTTQLGLALAQHLKTTGPHEGRLMHQLERMPLAFGAREEPGTALESPELLNQAARALVETLRVDHVGIVIYDYIEHLGTVIAEYPDNGIVGTQVQLAGPLQQRLRSEGAPVVVNNVDEAHDLGTDQAFLQQLGVRSIAILPMIVQDELIGSIRLHAFYSYRHFTDDEINAATAITSQLAISARNAQLYQELKRRANQLERIADLSRRITSTFDRSRIFQIAKEETEKLIDADLIIVALRSAGAEKLSLYMLTASGPVVAEFPIEQAALRFVFHTAEPLVLDDISGSDDPDYRLLVGAHMRAAAIVPLVAGGRTIGAYGVLYRTPGHYSSMDLAILEQIGNQLAIALENVRLYMQTSQRAETERLMNRLSGGIQSRGDLQGMLLGTVQEIAEALGARRARVRLQMPGKTEPAARSEPASRPATGPSATEEH